MIRLRRASALVTLYLLASATTACAECAWVLWLDQTSMSAGRKEREWTPITAGPNSRECERALTATIKAQSKPRGDETVEVSANLVTMKSADLTMFLRYVCLPDTVDPRGPKGGTR